MKDWRPRIGEKVKLVGRHPYAGNYGRIVRHETWMGSITCVAKLRRKDALDGHEVGITKPEYVITLKE